jgi:membrane fusion protein (multidrug efflux system)
MNFNLLAIKKPKRHLAWIFALSLLTLTPFVYRHFHSSSLPQTEGVWVEAEEVKRGAIPIEIHAVGSLVAERQIAITPNMAGHIVKIFFKDGSFVSKGAPLIQLDDTIPKAQLASAQADFVFSKITYQRRETLGKKGLWPVQEIDQARADLEEKKALLQEKQATVDKLLLVAPFDGVLGKAQVSLGHYVTPGQALVGLTDIQYLRAEFSVSEKYLASLKLGQTVKIMTSVYPGKLFEGKIAYISPTIDTADRSISLYAEVANPDHLLTSGMSVSIRQTLGTQNATILVPARSIMATLDGQQVYKVINNKAYAVPVLLGQRNEEAVEVLQGLSEKDLVVVAGQQKLHDDMDVKIKT